MAGPFGLNVFSTAEYASQHANKKNSKSVKTWNPAIDYPIGLMFFDFDRAGDIRIKTYFDSVKYNDADQTFDGAVHIDIAEETFVTNVGVTWLDDFKHDREFQHGKLTLKRDQLTANVTFPVEYSSQPAVVVWLSGLDVGHIADWSLSVKATNIFTKGFQLTGSIWSDTKLNSLEATWIAYPASRPNIDSGTFDTADVRDKSKPVFLNSQQINFTKKFEREPRVYIAFNLLNSGAQLGSLRLYTYTADKTTKGLTAHINAWGESNIYSAAAQWIAIQDY